MPNSEKPMSPRETFDKNEAGIAQKKQAIAEAATAGDYDKVAALAQEAKGMETARVEMSTVSQEAIDENKAVSDARTTQEKAQRQIEIAEQSKRQAEKDSQEAATLLGKLTGKSIGSPPTEKAEAVTVETPVAETVSPAQPEAPAPPTEAVDWREAQRISTEEIKKREKASNTLNWFDRSSNSNDSRFKELQQAYEDLPYNITAGRDVDKPSAEYDQLAAKLEALKAQMVAEAKARQEAELNRQ